MKIKTSILRKAIIVMSFCVLNNISFGQIIFKDKYLKILDKIAISSTPGGVNDMMKAEKYVLDDKGENPEDGGTYFVFTGSVDHEIMISYSKEKELIFIAQDILTLNLVFCEMELADKGFTKLSATEEKEDGINIRITKWGKAGYPYRFVLHQSEEMVSQLTLQSKISSGY